MDIQILSKSYQVRYVKEEDLVSIYQLCKGNPQYYLHCPPEVSMESIRSDRIALPNGKNITDKYYIGFWDKQTLIAVMDMILAYPNKETVWIGFFMTTATIQRKGIGTTIIQEIISILSNSYHYIKLGYVESNKQSENFWKKNGFHTTGEISKQDNYTVILMQKDL